MLNTKTHTGNFVVAQMVVSAENNSKRLQVCPESFIKVINQCALNPSSR